MMKINFNFRHSSSSSRRPKSYDYIHQSHEKGTKRLIHDNIETNIYTNSITKIKMYSIKDSHTYPLMDSEQVKLIPSTLKKPAAEVPPDDKSVHSEIQSPIRRNS